MSTWTNESGVPLLARPNTVRDFLAIWRSESDFSWKNGQSELKTQAWPQPWPFAALARFLSGFAAQRQIYSGQYWAWPAVRAAERNV